jgi:hypothetical protein
MYVQNTQRVKSGLRTREGCKEQNPRYMCERQGQTGKLVQQRPKGGDTDRWTPIITTLRDSTVYCIELRNFSGKAVFMIP